MLNIINSIKLAGKSISKELKTPSKLSLPKIKHNTTGDLVKPIDIIANNIFIKHLSQVESIAEIYSEEEEFVIKVNETNQDKSFYAVAFDPLDGSINVDTNSPTGSLFCIYDKNQVNGNGIVAAGYILYSTITQMVLAINGEIKVFNLIEDEFEFNSNLIIPDSGSYYSHNDSNNKFISNEKNKLFLKQLSNCSNLRYSGCLVADLNLLLIKGGCFCYPGNDKNINGKIRLLYEGYPAAFIVETAGGFSRYNDTISSLLTQPLLNIHQQSSIFLMSNWEKNLYDYL